MELPFCTGEKDIFKRRPVYAARFWFLEIGALPQTPNGKLFPEFRRAKLPSSTREAR
jgi:hypothetical protein